MGDRTHNRAAYEPVPHWDGVPISRADGATMYVTGEDYGSDAKRVRTNPPGALPLPDVTTPGDTAHSELRKELHHATTWSVSPSRSVDM
jgi:hypothetical protein